MKVREEKRVDKRSQLAALQLRDQAAAAAAVLAQAALSLCEKGTLYSKRGVGASSLQTDSESSVLFLFF